MRYGNTVTESVYGIYIALITAFFLAILAVTPAAAADDTFATNITRGDSVFLGESGLDISRILKSGNNTLAYYSKGNPSTDVPSKTITLTESEIENFYVDQTRFGDCIGPWYAYNRNGTGIEPALAFYVMEPSLEIGVYRWAGLRNVNGKKLVENTLTAIRIDSSFVQLFGRAKTDANLIDGREAFDFYAFNRSGELNYTQTEVSGYDEYKTALADALTAADGDADNVRIVLNRESVPGIDAHVVTPDGADIISLTASLDETFFFDTPLTAIHPDIYNYFIWPYLDGVDLEPVFPMYQKEIEAAMGDDYNGVMPVWMAGTVVDMEGLEDNFAGDYHFYADININGMKDNLGEITGKTVSEIQTVTVEAEYVEITADKEAVVRNNEFGVRIESNTEALYAVWITDLNFYNCDEVPAFLGEQSDVDGMSYTLAKNTTYKSSEETVADDLPQNTCSDEEPAHDYTGNYAVVAKLDEDGVINIGLLTAKNTTDTYYTIRAQKIIGYIDEEHTGYELDPQLYDTADVRVVDGIVTISLPGDGSYCLGDEVTLSGNNVESDYVYLFIRGPNLPPDGGKLDNPKVSPSINDSTRVTVNSDDTWKYRWDTSNSALDAGVYKIYATTYFALLDELSNAEYAAVSVTVNKPFVTAATSSPAVAKGDDFYIRGTALGNPTQGVAVWILGKNYWNGECRSETSQSESSRVDIMRSEMVTETVNDDGSFRYKLDSSTTKELASGQYFAVVHHPMYNGEFDVFTEQNADAGTIEVITNPKGAEGVNGVAFIIAGRGKLQGSDAAEALITAINSPNIDDTYKKITFIVEEPWIRINPIGDRYAGDRFSITGTTNLAVGDTLIVEVISSSFRPTLKTEIPGFSEASSAVKVTEGSVYNEWSFDLDASDFDEDEYIVNVKAVETDAAATTTFNILSGSPTAASSSGQTEAANTTEPTVRKY